MPWLHNYSAVRHSLSFTAMVAALPIFFLFWALAYKRMKGYLAASLTLLLMLLVAVTASRTAPHDSGPMWVAKPLSYDFSIHYTSPV